MGLLGRRRRRRNAETEGKSTLMELAASVYEDGDDAASLKQKILQELDESGESRPFIAFLKALLEVLLPLLIQILTKSIPVTVVLVFFFQLLS